MPWPFSWPDGIKKRACRYLLQHYLGHFLKEKLTLDQLSVDLYNGTGTIHDVQLDVMSLNEALDTYNVPIEIVDGFIGTISVTIPWSALINDSTVMEVQNLELTIQPKQRADNAGVMLDSMISSMTMTSSMQLAEECLKQDPTEGEQQAENAQPFEGLEKFAQTIEAVLSKIKVSFIDTIVRLEHLPKEAKSGAGLEFRIKRVEYFDDQAKDMGSSVDRQQPDSPKTLEPAAFAFKNFHLHGVTIYCDEFLECHRTFSRNSSFADHTSQDSSKGSLDPNLSPPLSPPGCWTKDANPDPTDNLPKETDPIQVATLIGKQELKLKIKQSEELAGPKLEVDCQIGSAIVHLSPRQVHLLIEIANGLAAPSSCDDSNVRPKLAANKPMRDEDYHKIEHDLQHNLQWKNHHHNPMQSQMWMSSDQDMMDQALEDSEEDEDHEVYFELDTSQSAMETSMESDISSVTSRSTSTTSSYFNPIVNFSKKKESPMRATMPRAVRMQKRQQSKILDYKEKLISDPAAELTRYKLKAVFLSVVVLHEDPVAKPGDAIDPGVTSAEQLLEISKNFFQEAHPIAMKTGSMTELIDIREEFSKICPYDHLGLLAKPLKIECNQRVSDLMYSLKADLTLGMAELVEVLFNGTGARASFAPDVRFPIENVLPAYSEILTFHQDEQDVKPQMYSSMHAVATPCVHIHIDTLERTAKTSRRSLQVPKTEISIELSRCSSEIDISLVDRIHALLNPQPLVQTNMSSTIFKSAYMHQPQSYQSILKQTLDEGTSGSERPLDLHISSTSFSAKVRFPVPDLRSTEKKLPWWTRSLRNESLILVLTEADFKTTFCDMKPVSEFEFTCKDAHGLFDTSPEDSEPTSFLRATTVDQQEQQGFGWPRVVVKIFPESNNALEETNDSDETTPQDSLNGACQFEKPESSPFSSKKTLYEGEEKVVPGDKQEMSDFQDKAVNNTKMTIDLNLPNVNGVLPSKEFFELLYNRICNDLLMWEPLAPSPTKTETCDPFYYMQGGTGLRLDQFIHQDQFSGERFGMCKSGLQNDSDSDPEESLSYMSHGQNNRNVAQRHLQSKACVSLNITQGRVTLSSPIKNEEGEISKEKHGVFVLDVEEGSFFNVTNFGGDRELLYMCVQAHKVTLFHDGFQDIPSRWPELERASGVCPAHLNPTIYLSEGGVVSKLAGCVGQGGDTVDMLSIAIKCRNDYMTGVKNYLVALGIRGATLQHRMTNPGQNWFSQITELFDVKDQAILGYTVPKVLTELHVHLWSCAVDYRPVHLPLRAMLTVETFSISSNITIESNTSLLRFIVDESALYLSENCSAARVDIKRHYVCVADMGLFELSLRSRVGLNQKYPKLDLRASNNILHIRTCSDSAKALAELIIYFANDGDLNEEGDTVQSSIQPTTTVPQSGSSQSLSDSPKLSQSNIEQVHDMMADAMRESSSSGPDSMSSSQESDCGKPREVFFFPDEGKAPRSPAPSLDSSTPVAMSSPATAHRLNEAMAAREEVFASESDSEAPPSDDEEFCIIDDPGMGIAPRDGEPKIRVLAKETVEIIDNYFKMPEGKIDQLKAPEHFPSATYRYTLSEMSLVWYMYGGKDFEKSQDSKSSALSPSKSSQTRSSKRKGSGVGTVGWQARGGKHRDIDVLMELQLNKVRLQYEIFPENTEQASRQILLINEIELRDRLVSSKINKFLYHYISEIMPRQSQANMLVIKALHIRPDPSQLAQECSLKVSVLPLRLNIDQDALDFMRIFFSEICGDDPPADIPSSACRDSEAESMPPKSLTPQPVMGVGSPTHAVPDPQEFLIKFDEFEESRLDEEDIDKNELTPEEAIVKEQPIFFKSFVFSPDVPIRLDYHGKRMAMEQGTITGLVAGLAQLNCSELKLKRINHRHGLLGYDRLVAFTLSEWFTDIKHNQIHSILGGVGPMHSLVQLVKGIRDFFWLPVEQYKKDGRIVRGIQRGTHSFTTSTAMAALELTNRLVQTVQYAAEVAYDMVSPGPSVTQKRYYKRLKRTTQPADLREGVTNAYYVMKEGITGTAQTIAKVARDEHEIKGMSGAVGGVLRQVPPTVIQPVILVTEATSNVLGGMRNQLLPDKKKEDEDKWKPYDD